MSNIVFANGKIDPWIAGSVNFKASEKTLTLNIDKAAHHLDLWPSNKDDPKSVIDAWD